MNVFLFQRHVRDLYKEVFDIDNDDDFVLQSAAPTELVQAYEEDRGPGPDLENIQFDMGDNNKSSWNRVIFAALVARLVEKRKEEDWRLPEKTQEFYLGLIVERFKRLKQTWNRAQRKVYANGDVETVEDVEMRLVETKERRGEEIRRATRRRTVSTRDLTYLLY